jgi:Ca2+-binding RTX toxin-like protein
MRPRASRGGRTARRTVGTVLASLTVLALAAPAGAATVNYPNGVSTFEGGPSGWAPSEATCSLLTGSILCSTSNTYNASGGNPGGAIVTSTSVTANVGGTFQGVGTWVSPPFTLPNQSVARATFAYDRELLPGGVANLQPTANVAVTLIDQSTAGSIPAFSETLTANDTVYGHRTGAVAPAALVPGHTYRLQIRTQTTSSQTSIGLLGTVDARYDNVALAVDDGSGDPGYVDPTNPGGGGGGGGGGTGAGGTNGSSAGVVYVLAAGLSSSDIASLFSRFSENAEVGHNSGGTLIPISACTILGTPANDTIVGTSGNDVICGLGGNDVITGNGGRDLIDGGSGNDRESGGAGGDLLLGLAGNDRLSAGSGNDRAGGGAGKDTVSGSTGNDRLSGGSGNDRVGGGSGNDTVNGRSGADSLTGGTGNDKMTGVAGNDKVAGNAGKDRISGGTGKDRISGGAGNDRITARDGRKDRVDGGTGRDRASVDRIDSVKRVP